MTPEERIAETVAPMLTITPLECAYREETILWYGPLPDGEDEDDFVRDFTIGHLVNDPRRDESRRVAAAVVAAVRSWPAEEQAELLEGTRIGSGPFTSILIGQNQRTEESQ